jgi:hypothetical protein
MATGAKVLIVGEPNKILRDLRNSKGSKEQFGIPYEIPVSGVNHNVFVLYAGVLGQGMRYSNVTASILSQLTTITCRLVKPLLNAAIRQSVPS